jgi:ParB-like chromosome segregation protein Spo0J
MSDPQLSLQLDCGPNTVISACRMFIRELAGLQIEEKIEAINAIRESLHLISPFKSEPVDFVRWVKSPAVHANDYNPNSVAPPEMELLRTSISQDGYTQPIVGMLDEAGAYEVIDGFHRHRVGKECADIQSRIHGYLPIVQIRSDRTEKSDRMASTIRHNRARGKHKVEAMSDIVVELKRRNWSDEKISKNLGMDPDEVLRLCQITGLAEAFTDQQFSQAWEVGIDSGVSVEIISDVLDGYSPKDGDRILHTWDKWECFRAGFYAERPPGKMTQDEGEEAYRAFLSDCSKFEAALIGVTTEWKNSCEHYLTNDRMNRIAWLGQASVAYALGIPSGCRAGYSKLESDQKRAADELALSYLNRWLSANGREPVTHEQAGGRTEAELY